MGPFKFKQNRVWRVYEGGKLIDRFRGVEPGEDGELPEDWIASVVEANNPQRQIKGEGVSVALLGGSEVAFDKLAADGAEELLGAGHVNKFGRNPGFLTKLLDSAIRLPIQAHPDNATALRLFNSRYGKTEAWIVLGTRKIKGEEPYLMLGFNENFDREVFTSESLSGKYDKALSMLHKHGVKPGDTLLLRGGMPHAIGPGVFLVEIMEPTDLVVQPELRCGRTTLMERERFGGLPPEQALEIFHYNPCPKTEAWASARLEPERIGEGRWRLIDREKVKHFGAEKLVVKGRNRWPDDVCAAGIVCEGELSLRSEGSKPLGLRRGDTFFIPASAGDRLFEGDGEVILALPPA